MTDVHALTVRHSVNTTSSARRAITIQTVGGIPATAATDKQIGFEYVGSMGSDGTNGFLRLVEEESTQAPTADDTGIQHFQPCSATANLHSVSADKMSNTMKKAWQAGSN